MNTDNTYADEILVVDDNPANLKLLEDILSGAGYRVRLAADGELALRSVKIQPPALILLDIRMPGMDGYEVCHRLKENEKTRSVPVIFLSILEDESEKIKAFQIGAVDYINKPIRSDEVLQRIHLHLSLWHTQMDLKTRNAELEAIRETLEEKVKKRSAELERANEELRKNEQQIRTLLDKSEQARRALLGILEDQKQAEEKVRASEERLRLTMEAGHIGSWDWDLANDRWYGSPIYYTMLGYEPEADMADRSKWLNRVHPDDRDYVKGKIQDVLTGANEEYRYEARLQHADGTYRWVYVCGFVVTRDEEGQLMRMLGIRMDITERKQAEEALKENEERMQLALRGANIGLFDYNIQNNTLIVDDGWFEMLGYSPDEIKIDADTWWSWIHPEDRIRQAKAFQDHVEGRNPYYHLDEYRARSKSGDWVWLMDHGKVIEYDSDGKPLRLVGIHLNITERKQDEEALKESEERFRIVVKNSIPIIFLVNQEGKILLTEGKMLSGMGLQPGDLVGESVFDLWQDHPAIMNGFRMALSGEVFEGVIELNEHIFEVFYSPYKDLDGNIIGVAGMGLDITERKRAEEKILRIDQRLRLHSEQSPLGFLEWDENFRVMEWNAACERIFGYTREEAIGRHAKDLILPIEVHGLVDEIFHSLMNQTGGQHSINENVTKDGRMITCEWYNTTLVDKDGKAIGVASICQDITERKQMEQERLTHLQFLKNMDNVNRAIQGANDLETMMSNVLDKVLSMFDCDRAYLMYPCNPDAATWYVPLEQTKPEHPGVLTFGQKVPMDEGVAQTLRLLLNSEGPVKFGPDTLHPLPEEVAEQFGFKCFMAMAIYPKEGMPWQFGIHQCSYARTWTKEEEVLFQEIGRRLADSLSSLLSYRNLQESQGKLAEAQRIAHIGNWELDLTSDTLTWSDESFRIFEIDPDKFVATFEGLLDTIHPDDREAVNFAYTHSLKTRTPYSIDHRLRMPDGRIKYVHEQCETIYDTESKPLRSVGTVQDVTNRKQAEQEISWNLAVNQALSSLYIPIVTVDTNIKQIADIVLERCKGLTCSVHGFVAEIDPTNGNLIAHTLTDMMQTECNVAEDKFRKIIFSHGADGFYNGLWGHALNRKEPFYTNDATKHPASAGVPEGHITIEKFLTVPVLLGSELVGQIAVSNPSRPYTDQDLAAVKRIAEFFALAIQDKRTQEEIRKLNQELEERVDSRTAQLEAANKELEAFAYSVSHDLRAPLRGIDGFSQILLEEYRDKVDEQGKDYLQRVRIATQRMGQLIDDMLTLSHISRSDMTIQQIDLSSIATQVAAEIRELESDRQVEFVIQDGVRVMGDERLLRIVLENLLQNAWKFTSMHPTARIEFGMQQQNGMPVYFVRDDGAGFDMKYAQKLFGAFQRLHAVHEFPGTGVGLATVKRIIHRHGGKVWAEGYVEKGATIYFTI